MSVYYALLLCSRVDQFFFVGIVDYERIAVRVRDMNGKERELPFMQAQRVRFRNETAEINVVVRRQRKGTEKY